MAIVLQNRLAHKCKNDTASQLAAIYGQRRASRILLAATEVDSIESKWRKIWLDELTSLTQWIIDKASRTGQLDLAYVDFSSIAMEHSLDVMRQALEDSVDFLPEEEEVRLAKAKAPPKAKVPTNFKALRILWDKYRKKKYIPPRQRAIAERVKKAYLKRVQAEWVKHGEAFRSGDTAVRTEAVRAIMKGADVGYVRAKMIVETETTYYYNKTRRAVFDQSPDVSHYLFMAIRDHRTTEWCKSRHGLVYAKDDPLLKEEMPPCFSGDTPVLTIKGWKDISTVTVGEMVWTHENRWRRIKKIHYSSEKLVDLLQIGFGLATYNHPYIERSTGIVEAELFKREEGIWAGTADMQAMLKASLDAMVQKGSKVLLDQLPHNDLGGSQIWRQLAEMEGWKEEAQTRLYWCPESDPSEGEQAGIRIGAYFSDGKPYRSLSDKRRSGPSHQSGQNRQSNRQSSTDGKRCGAYGASPQIRRFRSIEIVYNLEVEEDHTYYAGGYLVHNCHWNCRSELLPLTSLNPKHKKLIDDAARQRRNHKCKPLPPEWQARS